MNLRPDLVEEEQLLRGELEQHGVPHGHIRLFVCHNRWMPASILRKNETFHISRASNKIKTGNDGDGGTDSIALQPNLDIRCALHRPTEISNQEIVSIDLDNGGSMAAIERGSARGESELLSHGFPAA